MLIYTPIEEAGKLIRKRWADKSLREAVEQRLGGDIPEILKDGPSGMIWRHVCTPDGEFERFLELCQKVDLKPVCFEYVQDKFAARNTTKYTLTNLPFKNGVNRKSETIVERKKIIDFKDAEKKRICDLQTLWGENLTDFHHLFLQKVFPEVKNRVFDLSEWVKRHGCVPKNYYFSILSFAICHTVLFEDFDSLKSEESFANQIILPAFEAVEKCYGVKPIVVKLSDSRGRSDDPFWNAYSEKAKKVMTEHVKKH